MRRKRYLAHGKNNKKIKNTFREFKPNLNELKRLLPGEFGKMMTHYVEGL